jgi:hypothetical protein
MSKEIVVELQGLKVHYNTETFGLKIDTGYKIWIQDSEFKPYVEINTDGKPVRFYFENAGEIIHEKWETGIGKGIKSQFSKFSLGEKTFQVSFETLIWIDNTYGNFHFEVTPVSDEQGDISSIAWPGPFELPAKSDSSYTVLPIMQGVIIPGGWKDEVKAPDGGRYYTRGSYMPWWGQIKAGSGYIAIAETPWDGGYIFSHPAGGPTHIGPAWYPSLGRLGYKRKMRYTFLKECTYIDLCKIYRAYLKQNKEFVTLEEKAVRNPAVNRLIGTPVIHSSIYYHTEPVSYYYDKENPKNNDVMVSFNKRNEQLLRLKKLGVDKAFFHLDGWGKRGYDNLHPDIFPPCEQAGGWDGMKLLSDTCKQLGYFFATHDQYRDYYLDADTYDEEQAVRDIDGKTELITIWAGGEQTVLCAQLAPYYVKRNVEILKDHGIELGGTYLDVFSVVDLDECFHKEHRMTRKECMEKRRECFKYVISEGILISSEETVDWAVPDLDLVYRSNYYLRPQFNQGKPVGIPVPLFNLVYHDCLAIPWFLRRGGEEIPESDNGLLHALLNGGLCYLNIEADNDEINKAKVVCELHERVGKMEMLKHEFVGGNFRKQRTTFADGTTVEVNFDTDEYSIIEGTEQR